MIVGVADTHAAAEDHEIAVSTISLTEVVYLSEKKRLPMKAYEALQEALADPDHVLTAAPLTVSIVEAMQKVSREQVPDMPDRILP